ncbi:uncharacterized protein LOC101893376 isoform X2 [Musca domestica]|uniref:Uncharacterized protein LOC101893376 n=1 Tax=Musca domestica TaxID=7370 RepID=A0A1I8MDK2_MUSDO|nr:uncharacterized protein LOC101893376 isoform X2 [Musca domestica]
MSQSPTGAPVVCEIGGTQPSPAAMPTWYSRHHLASMAGGALLFISGGMAFAHGLEWASFRVTGFTQHFHSSWFIAMMIGTVISMQISKYIPKKFIMLTSSLLILAGGIIFLADHSTIDALVAGRYLNGIAVGLLTTQFLCHTGDISRVNERGACLGLEQFSLTLGMTVEMIITTQWGVESHLSANRLHGLLDVVLALLSAIALWYFVESPVDFLRMRDEPSALASLARLQRPPKVNKNTSVLLQEHSAYLSEQENLGARSWLGPLAKMLIFRSMMLAFTFSLPLSKILEHSAATNVEQWPIITTACLRLVGSFVALVVIDKVGRKLPSLFASFCAGALMLAISVICLHRLHRLTDSTLMSYVAVLCMALQFSAGLFAPISSAYMGEAFPIKAKQYCVAACVILEQVIHAGVIVANVGYGVRGLLLAESIMILIASLYFCLTMPETKHKNLREAQKMFRYFFNWKFY